jgi:hypothetical protein
VLILVWANHSSHFSSWTSLTRQQINSTNVDVRGNKVDKVKKLFVAVDIERV